MRPPTRSRASSMRTCTPAFVSARAAASPAAPAPMTTTSAEEFTSVWLLGPTKLIEIRHEYPQSKARGNFGVAGYQLFLIVVEIKIKRVFWIHVNDHQISIVHRKLAETELRTAIKHVVSR